jgi:GTP-binding protein LepA
MSDNIRNFTIIAHIDHGKSTLADRMIEITNTVEKRKMKDQVLDQMDLERERGITIKMQPVRMKHSVEGKEYILNLIDTPGHIDFSYEVSRALKAVEGSIVLVDSTQGVQAQTLSVISMAQGLNLKIIPVISKIDSPLARKQEVKEELAKVLDCDVSEILEVSGKTGEGVQSLLNHVVEKIPEPKNFTGKDLLKALVFDFEYSSHRGIIVYIRIFSGEVKKGDQLLFKQANVKFNNLENGIFTPTAVSTQELGEGEIGYIVTGIKQPGVASVGDTVTQANNPSEALSGYMTPKSVVWASVFSESQDDFILLKQSLSQLKLTDSSFSFEEESSGSLGRGFRCGFLGMLHLEIIIERLKREFSLDLIVTTPTITYKVKLKDGSEEIVYSPSFFPDDHQIAEIMEPWVNLKIISPEQFLGQIMQLMFEHEAIVGDSDNFGDGRVSVSAEMSLRELMRNFFDELKSISSGFASLSYEIGEMKIADVTRLDILIADEVIPAFSKVVSRRRVQEESEETVKKIHEVLPRQLFVMKIQGKALGRILSSETVKALRKDVTGYLYGGDVTRKKKLLEKQKKGKKKMKSQGRVNIPQEVFLRVIKRK